MQLGLNLCSSINTLWNLKAIAETHPQSYTEKSKLFYISVGQMVYSVRRRCGQQLAIEAPVEADLVSTVPESATPAALGYAQKVLWMSFHSELLIKCL